MKPLLFLPSPRDIPEVKESVDKLNVDKLWVKYHPQEEAYQVGRNWFLYNYEYTHLIIHPDDMITTQKNLDLLLGYPNIVVSGWTPNTTMKDWKERMDSNLSYLRPPTPPSAAQYEDFEFIPVKLIEDLLKKNVLPNLLKVKFLGFSLQLIPRKILEQIPFRGDQDCCIDSCFSLDLDYNRFEQFADIRIRSKHLPFQTDILVGKKPKSVIFEKDSN